jgi:hypothetical protein
VGKPPKGAPRSREGNPLPFLERGVWLGREEGVTTIGGAPIREDVRVLGE